jgi:hypothetical protein
VETSGGTRAETAMEHERQLVSYMRTTYIKSKCRRVLDDNVVAGDDIVVDTCKHIAFKIDFMLVETNSVVITWFVIWLWNANSSHVQTKRATISRVSCDEVRSCCIELFMINYLTNNLTSSLTPWSRVLLEIFKNIFYIIFLYYILPS